MSNKPPRGTEEVEGIASLIDTDLYKLTMQCAVLKSYPDVDVTYAYTNRTPDLKLSRKGFEWIQAQVAKLGRLRLLQAELEFLQNACPYLPKTYLAYLEKFSFKPDDQLVLTFTPADVGAKGDVRIDIKGKWAETILYEIPLLVLVSEAYFKFSSTDWNYEGQEEKAFAKGLRLLENGCLVSEFGTRRRRSYHTQELVLNGLVRAMAHYQKSGGGGGELSGTSNVHFAHRMGLNPIGTIAHEWFMGIAAITSDYTRANEIGLRQWIDCFGEGVLSITLTDTFGTPHFLRNFASEYPPSGKPYAEIFAGVRQDSGDPEVFVKCMRRFYDVQGIKSKKIIVFSDSLDVDLCLKYKEFAEREGFMPSFGIGTFLTNDFAHLGNPGRKSWPLNIVVKINSANGKPAVKISDNISKNTGDRATVERVKQELGYVEREWESGDEQSRWGSRA
ncbi:nicotinate phosphoribosyltransferase [Tuber magnatum]|uniref:Nicotinate phosphoribosyltransferase n=1 Tax=Tuber magnatum TaxID=42249 RepID=A0A317SVR6_9PEZI|nr:nicotinate phosphoribosyltransferase [Tuber magnatum]